MRKIQITWFTLLLCLASLTGCQKEPSGLSLGLEDNYWAVRLEPLSLTCGLDSGAYQWSIIAKPEGDNETLLNTPVSNQQTMVAVLPNVGVYQIQLLFDDGQNELQDIFSVYVQQEQTPYTPYISDILAYEPAPGRGVNENPTIDEQMSRSRRLSACRKILVGSDGSTSQNVTLGGYGGSVLFAFDHVVLNVPNKNDFIIYSPALEAPANSQPQVERPTANVCPAIVQVALDTNGNGVPDDDEWYELAGSAEKALMTNYIVTYDRPTATGAPGAVDEKGFNLVDYIAWSASNGEQGYIPRVGTDENYWPVWLKNQQALIYSGNRLPDIAQVVKKTENQGSALKTVYYVNFNRFEYGYACNTPDNSSEAGLDIANAVDIKTRKPVSLPGIQFVRVYNAINQTVPNNGTLVSRIKGAKDLHLNN